MQGLGLSRIDLRRALDVVVPIRIADQALKVGILNVSPSALADTSLAQSGPQPLAIDLVIVKNVPVPPVPYLLHGQRRPVSFDSHRVVFADRGTGVFDATEMHVDYCEGHVVL